MRFESMISKTAKRALQAVLALAEHPDQYQGAASLAQRVDAPPNYLGKLLQLLAQRRIVRSQKGLGGGFRLGRSPDEITLYDVIDPMDPVERWSECAVSLEACTGETPCLMHAYCAPIREAYVRMLKTSTLADVLAGGATMKSS